ncbi:uncharacterized protein MELLADRAFT_93707 [Melampsora larici-populina 98AG31]|uniref:Uncharacterized protein n=1 Tax=Melampsora larici-populina (strain 98AG31 / pathotype 3-4-7) TaxID=747676 RepID=F4S4Z5_MELLP|nr:uncharacterized protein MELLADRAFT_93707 [Melampsora larici-populina 98AG31]EGG00231.1 hypothetical protein MELLADRAFT_93707 [Melampsora larici-populina 98AG31]
MASSIEEWSALRAELVNTSAPELPNPARSACWALVGLSLLGAVLHFTTFCVSWISRSTERRFFIINALGYRRPILANIFPVVFLLHALREYPTIHLKKKVLSSRSSDLCRYFLTVNLAAITSLLTDLSSSRFRGRTNAIQGASYSLLICAGLFKVWDLAARLPSLSPGFTSSRPFIKPNIPPKLCTTFTYMSFAIVILLPVPCIVLTSTAIDTLDSITPSLITTIDVILATINESAVNVATQQIEQLEIAAETLAIHTRMLSGLHLLFTTVTLTGFLVTCFALTRSLRGQGYLFRDSLDYRYEVAAAKAKASGLTCLPPAHLPGRHHHNHSTTETPLCGRGELAALASKYSDLHSEASQLRIEAIPICIVAVSFLVLDLCVVTDAFKYPTRTSLGSILLIAIQWASWSWAGIPGPLLAMYTCIQACKPKPASIEPPVMDESVGLGSLSDIHQRPSVSIDQLCYQKC